MILILGGMSAGKRTYARSLGYTDEEMAPFLPSSSGYADDTAPVAYDVQAAVWADPAHAEALLPRLLTKQVVIINEVGSGVIPADEQERLAREQTGRLTVLLAAQATRVVRIVCGIPVVLKETEEACSSI